MKNVLEVQDLKVHFHSFRGLVQALDGITFDVRERETLGLVGETGCGKSVTALSILRLVPSPGRIVSGKILFEDEDILSKSEEEMRAVRGGKIAMIFQDPTTCLNPVFKVGNQLSEVIEMHQRLKRHEAWSRAVQMLDLVQIPSSSTRIRDYPHEFSGGMKQRVMIAMSLSCNPKLLIADEPTTALDVTVQAQILQLMKELKTKFDASILIITHDLGVIAEMCDRVAVMYAGTIAEIGDTRTIFKRPMHPYTRGLIDAVPTPLTSKGMELAEIPGYVPSLVNPPTGCRFHPRCGYAQSSCRSEKPQLLEVEPDHLVACPILPFRQ